MGPTLTVMPPGDPLAALPKLPFEYDLGNHVAGLKEMPLLKKYVERHSKARPLRGATALLIQHQLANQGPQIEALIELGLDPRKIYWLDIPYTSSERFRVTISDRHGIPEENFWVNRYRVLEDYSKHQSRRTQEIIRHILGRHPHSRLLVLDDGAYFLEAAANFSREMKQVGIVEQTTRGFIKLEDDRALGAYAKGFRIVNVAGSRPKRTLEAPWIGAAVLLALHKHLRDLATQSPKFRVTGSSSCVLLGYGTIGCQVAHQLRGSMQVHVFDSRPSRRARAIKDGFLVWERDSPPKEFKLVIGCSGRQSFRLSDRLNLDSHAILVSASSGSVELSRTDFIEFALGSRIDDADIETDRLVEDRIHQNLWLKLVDRRAVFLNAGFPINFDGRLSCIPARLMQPTALLMVHGAVQALAATEPEVVSITRYFGDQLALDFAGQLTPEERALLRPAAAWGMPRSTPGESGAAWPGRANGGKARSAANRAG